MNKYLQLIIGLIALFLLEAAVAAQPLMMKTEEIVVVYEAPLASAAREVVRIYPKLKLELEEFFGWNLDVRPQVVLVNDTRSFQKLTRNKLFVAFAVPDKELIVIDYSRMNTRPFTLSVTLKHELCHLLLHRHISKHNLPKWVDEGVCQWVSDGIGEIFVNKGWSGLDSAVMAGRIIPLKQLTDYFPRDGASLILAYEQSKSVINYVDRQYGYHAIMEILELLKNGETVETALMRTLAISHQQLEAEWLDHLESTPRWLVFLASHMYAIIFFLAAVLTFLGFIRLHINRKKKYAEWEEEDD
ncbi:hypothetical protein D1BOALGB6SA_2193 [Olavius sp. associated proteobacterium Delta 1]|nr:hypothetical protein D1BOALGB6SA_2193 [Olavius sp. associated proteobacterium Delta 1]